MKKFIGTVKESRSEARGCGGRITLIKLIDKENATEEFHLPGQHRIDVEEIVSVEYETHIRVNWVNNYSILNSNNTPKYTSTCF